MHDGSECIVKIYQLENGCVVEIRSAEQAAENEKSGCAAPYQDPWHSYAFKDQKALLAFLSENLDKAKPAPSYDDAFDMAAAQSEARTSPKSKKPVGDGDLGFKIHSTQRK